MVIKILICVFLIFMALMTYGLCAAAGNADDAEEEYWRRIEGYKGDKNG